MNTVPRTATAPKTERASIHPGKGQHLAVTHGTKRLTISVGNLLSGGVEEAEFTPEQARLIAHKLLEYAATVEAMQR